MGHLGLTPQSVLAFGGFKVQAKTREAAEWLIKDATVLQDEGVYAIVIEGVPNVVGTRVTEALEIPTIGIGAGAGCDGEVQVWHDMLGLGGDFTPRHAKHFAEAGAVIASALADYVSEVREGAFPGEEQCTHMDPRALDEVRAARRDRGTGTKE